MQPAGPGPGSSGYAQPLHQPQVAGQHPGVAGATYVQQQGPPGSVPVAQFPPAQQFAAASQPLTSGGLPAYMQQLPAAGPRPPQAQPQPQPALQPPRQPTPPLAGGSAQPQARPAMGFTPTQLGVLRNQIVAFKTLKSTPGVQLGPEVLAGIRVPPLVLPAPAAAPGPAAAPAAAAAPSTAPGGSAVPAQPQHAPPHSMLQGALPARAPSPASQPAQLPQRGPTPPLPQQPVLTPQQAAALAAQQAAAQQAVVRAAATPPVPADITDGLIRKNQGPLYSVAGVAGKSGGQVPPKAPPGHAGAYQMLFDASALVQLEYRKLLDRRRGERLAELKAAEKAAADPGFAYQSDKMPVGRARLELKKLALVQLQSQLRQKVEAEQAELMAMPERRYQQQRRAHRSNKIETARKDIAARAERGQERAQSAKNHRAADMGGKSAALRDLRLARNRLVNRAHERLAREHNKQKGDDRAMRLEALKAHDFEAYQELLRQQTGVTGGPGEKYEAITKFLQETEQYLHRLAGKIASVKMSAEASQAAARAITEARAKGLSEEEVQAAANAAAEDAAVSSSALVKETAGAGADAQKRYYQLAHSAQEEIRDQPTLLRPPNGAKLREYQMVGLQWMVSLYNNHLNGILADEMGLGKTVQVMSLIAYLMERKANYGPHLIIVPNAVLVNWKAELTLWLPSVRCVYYTGNKEERARKYAQEVQSLQFNVLVTTYEFIMRDRTKLSKVDWQYIVIDEAQRMKDRQSKLARDLDRFSAQRRLLLSGTPLQNDLQELWSLLNLLLPEVFDDKKMFAEWFGEAIASTQGAGEGDWLEMEKRVVVIHRLHQILEPFMLRRQVEDVESKLPPKVAMVVKVPMTPYQSAIYDWVKATGTIRLDPAVPMPGRNKRPYASLNNKCMELRKVCNHPMLSYPPQSYAVGEAIVRTCGKLVTLDRMLIKLRAAGHRVLLFSTMTRLLDLLEVYLQWRTIPGTDTPGQRLKYLRIDGSTSLEAREAAIQQFNAPQSDVFLFLLSIRAAGRGLNLQSSDTVVIYDPDPNPKNEEQAIARSHRIGQSKEVRVIHLEAVADAPQPAPPPPGYPAPPRRYADSIESLVRNQIQKIKIDMANEVIDAGRFDMQTSMEERRHTLESLLQDEDRLRRAENVVPPLEELNRMLARGPDEFELFQKMDRELQWLDPNDPQDIPHWLRWGRADLLEAMTGVRHKPDVAAELAALTGTVLHHHRRPAAAAAAGHVGPPRRAAAAARAAAARPQVPAAQALAALAGARREAAAAAAAAAASEAPEPTVTTTSMGMGDEDEEVMMAEMAGNDEEEEVLDQNIAMDDLTEAPSASQAGSMRRIQSTAATGTLRQPSATDLTGWSQDPSDASPGEPAAKRPRKGLSVHFMDSSAEGLDGEEG